MLFFLSLLATVAETTAAILTATGEIGTIIATGTTMVGGTAGAATTAAATKIGIDAATAGTLGVMTAGGTTTTLNVCVMEMASDVATN